MPGHAGEVAFHVLRVLAAAAGGADRGAHDQRHRDLSAGHVAHLGDVVDDLVEGQQEEVAVLHVDDRPHAHHRGAAGDAEEAEFGDRRVDHAVGKPLLQSQGDGERAAPSAGHGDVLADAEHARVALHFLGDRLAQGFGDTQMFRHGRLLAAVQTRTRRSSDLVHGRAAGRSGALRDGLVELAPRCAP